MPVDVGRAVILYLGIVEDNDLERDGRLRHKAVTGKAVAGIGRAETVTGRAGRGIKKLVQPLRSRQ